jgi:hypothetical protein
MITYEDCLALADLTPETVERVAAREGLTPIAAIGLASSWAVATKGKRSSRRTADDASPEPTTRPAIMLARVAPIRSGAERLAA